MLFLLQIYYVGNIRFISSYVSQACYSVNAKNVSSVNER